MIKNWLLLTIYLALAISLQSQSLTDDWKHGKTIECLDSFMNYIKSGSAKVYSYTVFVLHIKTSNDTCFKQNIYEIINEWQYPDEFYFVDRVFDYRGKIILLWINDDIKKYSFLNKLNHRKITAKDRSAITATLFPQKYGGYTGRGKWLSYNRCRENETMEIEIEGVYKIGTNPKDSLPNGVIIDNWLKYKAPPDLH